MPSVTSFKVTSLAIVALQNNVKSQKGLNSQLWEQGSAGGLPELWNLAELTLPVSRKMLCVLELSLVGGEPWPQRRAGSVRGESRADRAISRYVSQNDVWSKDR